MADANRKSKIPDVIEIEGEQYVLACASVPSFKRAKVKIEGALSDRPLVVRLVLNDHDKMRTTTHYSIDFRKLIMDVMRYRESGYYGNPELHDFRNAMVKLVSEMDRWDAKCDAAYQKNP